MVPLRIVLGRADVRVLPNLQIQCEVCRHSTLLSVDRYHDDLWLILFTPRLVCAGCGMIGAADVRPIWIERPKGESITGMQRR